MQEIEVYLNHNAQLELVGRLTYEQLRGNATYHFSYDAAWLTHHPHLSLSGDLQSHTGWQHATKRLFGCFTDALPDRWGRRLIDKREQILAQEENRIPRTFNDFDYLLQLDDYSRMGAFRLAKKAGIQVADTKLMALSGFSHHVLLSKRFDRIGTNRVHTVSAMTIANLHDGADASSGNGYLDIVDAIVCGIGVADAEANLRELYRRVAFAICIGNHDDHFRNHAFVLKSNGWTLSPAYDINPTNMLTQSLLISDRSYNSSLVELQNASALYLLSNEVASQIINEVKDAVRDWRNVATQCHISVVEQQRFAKRFEYCL